MFSAECKYAIRAIVKLAQNSSREHKIGGRELANRLEVATPFLLKILRKLAQKDVITSVKGPGGGYYLSDENKKQKFWMVLENLDCVSQINSCVLGLTECSEKNPCALHYIFAPFKNSFSLALRQMDIATFVKQFEENSLG